MAEESGDKSKEKASEGISQLAARILSQLSLSAWLPSACLVVATAFILALGNAADKEAEKEPVLVIIQALKDLGGISFPGIILMFVVVVISTMLTQAFAFEAIRVLEGYWGASRPAELTASVMCAWHRSRRERLERRFNKITQKAWNEAEPRIRDHKRKGRPVFDETRLEYLRQLLGVGQAPGSSIAIPEQEVVDRLRPRDKMYLDRFDWAARADPETIRRRANLEKSLGDYPAATRVLPTRLGNVLRRYEDGTGIPRVESMVDEVYDRLPFSLQVSHDEQRGRLDLYCSMTFVWLALVVIDVARLAWNHPWYTAVCVALTLLASMASYRAAVASARYYGELLLQVARYHPSKRRSPRGMRRLVPRPAFLRRLLGRKDHSH